VNEGLNLKKPHREVIRELAPTGELRAAINLGNPVLAQKAAVDGGPPRGIAVALAEELASRLGLPLRPITFDAAGKVFDAAGANVWDVAFLARDPSRAGEISFTSPYAMIEATYMVKSDSPFRTVAELDRPGVKIAVGRGAAYELHLRRTLKHAELVQSETSGGACDLFRDHGLDAVAGVRQPLIAYAGRVAGLRVLEDRIAVIEQAIGTPNGRQAASEFLRSVVEELKRNGFIAEAIERSGQRGVVAAPPEGAL
jgi:polar amino acid transport system substrate-binding protein